jgi:hypothetical protein
MKEVRGSLEGYVAPSCHANLSYTFFPCKQTIIRLKGLREKEFECFCGVVRINRVRTIRSSNYPVNYYLIGENWEIYPRVNSHEHSVIEFMESYHHELCDNCGCMDDNCCH